MLNPEEYITTLKSFEQVTGEFLARPLVTEFNYVLNGFPEELNTEAFNTEFISELIATITTLTLREEKFLNFDHSKLSALIEQTVTQMLSNNTSALSLEVITEDLYSSIINHAQEILSIVDSIIDTLTPQTTPQELFTSVKRTLAI